MLPQRSLVERKFGWTNRLRRPPSNIATAIIRQAMLGSMLRRLAEKPSV